MKKLIFCTFIVILFGSCGQKTIVYKKSTSQEKWQIIRDDVMVPGAPVSDERPLPNVLSEQEVLLKAADYAIGKGVLDPAYYAYQDNPALWTARIETPVLITNAENSEPGSYILTAVDDNGVFLAQVSVNSSVNASDSEFERLRSFALPNSSYHFITKREASELIQSQFPDSAVSEPMLITNLRLDDDQSSHMFPYWYFTVNDNARNVADVEDEYIIAPFIPGYTAIPGGVSNRAAIGFAGDRGDFHLKGYRMAKLNKPLRLFDKLEAARAAGGASYAPANYPTESVGIIPVPLK
jgi:hypothetical protein